MPLRLKNHFSFKIHTLKMKTSMNITFIGLGIMGSRMAKNLLKSNYPVTIYNRSHEKTKALVEAGALAAPSLELAVKNAEVVFTMLSTPEVVEKLALGPDGFVRHMRLNAIWVDCSTVNPSFSRKIGKLVEASGIRFLDAPVAGTKAPAENAQLTFLAGGDAGSLAQVQPLLEHMGQKIIHAGPTGQGSALKMLVNSMLAQSMALFAETVHLGEALGFSRDYLLDTLPNFPVIAPFTKAKAEKIRKGDYEEEFPLEWMHKDLHLATLSAFENNVSLFMANLTKELYARAKEQGLGREDMSAIFKIF